MKIVSPLIPSSSQLTYLRSFSTSEIKSQWLNTFGIDISDELQEVENIDLYTCDQTRLRFFVPASTVGSEKIYEVLEDFDWYYMPVKWEHDIAVEDLKGCKTVLEIGSGRGDFVRRLQESNFAVEGIEMNLKAIRHAEDNNIPVSRKTLKDILISQVPHPQFDAVCTFQVLEHVSDPLDFLKDVVKLTKVGGKIIIGVPNADSFLKYQYNLLDMPPHHMTQWQESTFRYLENIMPIKLSRTEKEPLSLIHANGYLLAYIDKWRNDNQILRIFFNRFTIPFIVKSFRILIRLGIGRFLIGQSLYVCFEKVS